MSVVLLLSVMSCSSPIRGTALPQALTEPADERPRSTSPAALSRLRGAFDTFKTALIEGDGRTAAALVAGATDDIYETARQLALHGTADQLAGVSLSMRVVVYSLRAEIDVETLQKIPAYKLVALSMSKGVLGLAGIRPIELGEIEVSGRRAYAELVADEKTLPFKFEFIFERSLWRLDMRSVFRMVNWMYTTVAERRGVTADQLLNQTLIKVYGVAEAKELHRPLVD